VSDELGAGTQSRDGNEQMEGGNRCKVAIVRFVCEMIVADLATASVHLLLIFQSSAQRDPSFAKMQK
jgi:hypothetical protein